MLTDRELGAHGVEDTTDSIRDSWRKMLKDAGAVEESTLIRIGATSGQRLSLVIIHSFSHPRTLKPRRQSF